MCRLHALRVLRFPVHGTRGVGCCIALATILGASGVSAQQRAWRYDFWLGVEETLTNNVNLEPSATRRGDLITSIAPGVRFHGTSARSKLTGTISVPILLYARTGGENNSVQPQVNVLWNNELVERFLFVEASANVSQQYLSAFGARPSSITTRTDNQYTSQTYRVTPYIRGDAAGDITYDLRDDNIWTRGESSSVNNAYTNALTGTVERAPRPLGWGADYNRYETKFTDQDPLLSELVRGRGLYQPDPAFVVYISGGFERNDYLVTDEENVIYGAGLRWRPNERTSFDASWEHRFFGASYNVAFNHRRPLSFFNFVAARNITSYPQQLAALGGGTDVAAALNALFASRIADPAQRQIFVDQFIEGRGLPPVLPGPVNLYTEQILLQESLTATVGLLGARNSMLMSVYRLRSEPITGSGDPPPDFVSAQTNNTQYGASLVWNTSLSPFVSLTTSVDALRTVNNLETGVTRQGSIRATLSSKVAPLTTVYGSLRYQGLRTSFRDVNDPDSTASSGYNEAALIFGLFHTFR
jgi:uncharacterized protein (PEP-CTERM system associated)